MKTGKEGMRNLISGDPDAPVLTFKARVRKVRGDRVEIRDAVVNVPNTPYHRLKYGHYMGNRLFYDFGDGASVMETYNGGVFNCTLGGRRIQIADAQAVSGAMLSGDRAEYAAVFDEWFSSAAQDEYIARSLEQFAGRVEAVSGKGGKRYVIDGVFDVDSGGTAHYMAGGEWRHLCIVVSDAGAARFAFDGTEIELNGRTVTILSKVFFLLFPRRDGVFLNQLPARLRRHAEELMEKHGG
ncbi:hypothetical protein CENSYa_0734 [Cenarchaeum symbiosum A]|uniref:Uncharacterized protein n=1 Tax=Cenarchaeum symbiosum (strain A) TaxID=414004 RepID=A0RVK0_CENSY|nr:hypothetical protein CENSYa_0734 [Cenarchaeum symbiosum A]